MQGEPNSAMVLNTKICREEDRVAKKMQQNTWVWWRPVTVAAEGDIVAKMKHIWRRRECEENRARVLIFLNVPSTSIFGRRP